MSNPFHHSIYTIRARAFRSIWGEYEIVDEEGNQVFQVSLFGFMGKNIRVFEGKSKNTEILRINRPSIFGPMSEEYDYPVIDSINESRIGTLRLPKPDWSGTPPPLTMDGWMLLDCTHQKVAYFKDVPDSENICEPTATLCRGGDGVIAERVPRGRWGGYVDDSHVCKVVKWGGLTPTMTLDCSLDTQTKLDRRLALSSVLVHVVLEIQKREQRWE